MFQSSTTIYNTESSGESGVQHSRVTDQENPKTDQMQTVNVRDTERHPSAPWPHQISLADAERPAKQLVPLVDLFGAVS